ncbi:hypothetical protein ACF068_06075 [Streptomyces sp. NPDC016309]|uniref:hypothetical protein n=1 Tax=Streptomyces sp. NPDC016309 TaxID=3364965 RepID=UPI0036F8A550
MSDGRAVDLENVTDELYGLRPDRFTAARDARAAEARKAGDRELADAVRALRRPTLAAWVSNLLVRRMPEETRSLAVLGDGLRRAHQELDGDRLRELSRKQHTLVTALARQARQLAADAGQPVGDDVQHEVEGTLHAVLADPDAADRWAAGRLVRPLSAPVGFAAALTAVPPRTGDRPAGRHAEDERGGDGGRTGGEARAQQDRHAQEERKRERRAAELREEARRAEEEARRAEEERDRAGTERTRAEEGFREAERRVDALSRELKEAELLRHGADEEVRAARTRFQRAERSARDARRRARNAAARAERGQRQPGGGD